MGLRRRESLAELLAAAALGDRDAFMSFYDETCAAAYALTRCLAASEFEAERDVRYAYARAWAAAAEFPAAELSPVAWLLAGIQSSASGAGAPGLSAR